MPPSTSFLCSYPSPLFSPLSENKGGFFPSFCSSSSSNSLFPGATHPSPPLPQPQRQRQHSTKKNLLSSPSLSLLSSPFSFPCRPFPRIEELIRQYFPPFLEGSSHKIYVRTVCTCDCSSWTRSAGMVVLEACEEREEAGTVRVCA